MRLIWRRVYPVFGRFTVVLALMLIYVTFLMLTYPNVTRFQYASSMWQPQRRHYDMWRWLEVPLRVLGGGTLSTNKSEKGDNLLRRSVWYMSASLQEPTKHGVYGHMHDFLPGTLSTERFSHITICTHASLPYLHHLLALSSRWDGMISAAVYVTDEDAAAAISYMYHLHRCSDNVRHQVSFHLYYRESVMNTVFAGRGTRLYEWLLGLLRDVDARWPQMCMEDVDNITAALTSTGEDGEERRNVSSVPDLQSSEYPVNVGRNLARINANTHYILTMDIEFLPSANLSSRFLRMVNSDSFHRLQELLPPTPKVYVLPTFEIKLTMQRPADKATLIKHINASVAMPFHVKICSTCHKIPYLQRWLNATPASNDTEDEMGIFFIAKWLPILWEPVYIGTNGEPFYDEHFTGYGSNKIQQVFEMCRADYAFYILDSAFIVHSGFKRKVKSEQWSLKDAQAKRNWRIYRQLQKSLDDEYTSNFTQYWCKQRRPPGFMGYFPQDVLGEIQQSNNTTTERQIYQLQ